MNPSTESMAVLINSILCFLDSNAFPKTLKRFLSEAQIKDDSWKACSFNLEEIFNRNFQTCDTKSVMPEKEMKVAAGEEELKGKKKKKKKNVNVELDPSEKDTNSVNDEAAPKEHANKKEKDKKKRKNKSDKSSIQEGEENDKSKDGKNKDKQGRLAKGIIEDTDNKEEIINKEKNSKKRKRSVSEENVETKTLEESKTSEGDDGKPEKKKSSENGHIDENQLQDSSIKKQDNEEDNSGRFSKKQRIESAESKSAANAFRRVKVEEVVFTDERLQDNSYWAKDGADIGYGAKAQEVLGQVKGRGFRHEKTKKKRGSYRGGQIDLESHSIKFNYSDEE